MGVGVDDPAPVVGVVVGVDVAPGIPVGVAVGVDVGLPVGVGDGVGVAPNVKVSKVHAIGTSWALGLEVGAVGATACCLN